MIKIERQNEIEKPVKAREYISLMDIPRLLNCSESTIRRDIDEMEQKGILKRSQGVVIWNRKSPALNPQPEMIYHYRQSQNVDAKKILGEFAAKFVHENDTLFLDTGTTMLEMAKHIPDMTLTVVTNDLAIAMELEERVKLQVIILGGFIRRGTHTVIGSMATETLANFHFQKAFFSPAGIDREGEFMFFNLQAMEIRQKACSVADQCVMVADKSKFGKKGFVKGFGFDRCDLLITDEFPVLDNIDWQAFCSSRIADTRTCL